MLPQELVRDLLESAKPLFPWKLASSSAFATDSSPRGRQKIQRPVLLSQF